MFKEVYFSESVLGLSEYISVHMWKGQCIRMEPVKRVDIAKLRKKMYTGSGASDVMARYVLYGS